MNPTDNFFLQRCIQLAKSASRAVYPNPYVGSVIVHEGKIIGEGLHKYSGGPHAEVNAVNSVKNPTLLPHSTIYVTLEPCSHFGKTPPCSDLIISKKIPRVVIGMQDPNPRVDGGGIKRLRDHGVEVVLAENPLPFEAINKVFLCNQLKKRPFIALKWAQSADGFIAKVDSEGQGISTPVSGNIARRYVHQLRAFHHGIMVGKATALTDNPSLTTRQFYGLSPIRLVFDRDISLPPSLDLLNDGGETWILNEVEDRHEGSVQYIRSNDLDDFSELIPLLYTKHKLSSILVEGGTNILQQFLDAGLWDEIHLIESPKVLKEGVQAPDLPLLGEPTHQEYMGTDRLRIWQNK